MTLVLKSGVKIKVPKNMIEDFTKGYAKFLKGKGEGNIFSEIGEESGKLYFFVCLSEIVAII